MNRTACLFERWLAIEQENGKSITAIYEEVNAACGMRYQSNWVTQMRSGGLGRKQMPVEVRRHMLKKVVPHDIPGCAALSETELNQLIENLI